ncbi:hypothetical protein [Mucilaginibacter ginsenosidivorax]|uniref:Uncharacterized protein n=1 Tax=Mucilaginibacter ginsenosidivorax TaxID=862126 RepID=A0A5B8W3D0_9SPHI|nr:hypothetical protein [Mucilaginibacter ginsenosidivorax]QEC78354.1 hypothetical protein FSB76_21300 [Mucilaginibacter ginsenosidivorax]
MDSFNIKISYAIISAIRAGICTDVPEELKLGYDIDTAEIVYNETMGYELERTVRYIEKMIEDINAEGSLVDYNGKK